MASLTIPTVVLFSHWMVVDGYVWPSSWRVSLNILPSLMFKNTAPNYASADDATTKGRMEKSV